MVIYSWATARLLASLLARGHARWPNAHPLATPAGWRRIPVLGERLLSISVGGQRLDKKEEMNGGTEDIVVRRYVFMGRFERVHS